MAAASHHLEGSYIETGTLRYGQTVNNDYGEIVEWRHWGCVTAAILGSLASVQLERVNGFNSLKPVDKNRVKRAITLRRVDASDIPMSAKAASAPLVIDLTQKKRKSAPEPGPSTAQVSSQAIDTVEDDGGIDQDNDDFGDELYCTMQTNVVGIQYYKGLVGSGEEALLVREANNKYDGNAIQVKNISHQQVGHLPRLVVAKLAPLLDRGLVTAEAIIREGNLGGGKAYNLPLTLLIYGASDRRDFLEPQLIWATPGQRGFPQRNQPSGHSSMASSQPTSSQRTSSQAVPQPSASQRAQQTPAQLEAVRRQQEALQKAAELKQMLQSLEKVDDEGRRASLLDSLCSVEDILELPLHPSPPGIEAGNLTVNLLRHQSQGLQWCIQREYPVLPKTDSDPPVQFWKFCKQAHGSVYYYNLATKSPQPLNSPPVLGRGGLCADSMGLGKTLTMLALIVATQNDVPKAFSNSTLIVVPLSVMSNWEKQLDDHVTPGTLKTCVYYGSGRSMTSQELAQHDVVITTYQVVTSEAGEAAGGSAPSKKKAKKDRSLFDVKWKRIILDEGHNIRNPKTKMAKAVCGLEAERRWLLSGTPIINSPKDLGSILTFLRICQPLDNEDMFKRLLLRPLKDGLTSGSELLRAIMSQACIRRTKEMQDKNGNYLVPLPPVEMIVVPVALTEQARTLYDEAEKLSGQRVERLMNSGGNVFSQSNILGLLTRLRQIALHPGLVPAGYLEELKANDAHDDASAIQVTPELKARLQAMLAQAIEDSEECPVCFDIMGEPRITPCTHKFCLACITEVISRDAKCPMDRRALKLEDLIAPPPPTDLTQAPIRLDDEDSMDGPSAKIDQLIHLLRLTPGGEKSLVFSQFTSFLDKIAEAFDEHGISYVKFDGQMSAQRRQEAIARFSVPLPEGHAPLASSQRAPVTNDSVDPEGDGDFYPDPESDDDDFVVSDDDCAFTKKKGKGKGKGKAKSKGKGKARSQKERYSSSFGENPRVMLISLKAGALGLNLTVANNVYLMDPWWQEGIESQAIDRCNRIGQKKNVHVYQLIAENTIEAKVLEIQERKKKLIKEAFSGIKGKETQRQKKEARLQELVELFGIRQQAASQAN